MKFREHRGGLGESLETIVELADFDALLKHIHGLLQPYAFRHPINRSTVRITAYRWDERIGWDTHIVTLDCYGVLGYTDGPVA